MSDAYHQWRERIKQLPRTNAGIVRYARRPPWWERCSSENWSEILRQMQAGYSVHGDCVSHGLNQEGSKLWTP